MKDFLSEKKLNNLSKNLPKIIEKSLMVNKTFNEDSLRKRFLFKLKTTNKLKTEKQGESMKYLLN